MKKFEKICAALLLAGVSFGMTSCYKSDIDDIRSELQKQDKRITDLEALQKAANGDIESLRGLVTALQGKDYVTAVTPLADGTGYTISFEKSGDVTIKNGADGATPVVSAKKDDNDGKYYWTVDGEWLTDGGNKLSVVGEKGDTGIAPQVRINATTGEWEVSTDEGQTWTTTGVVAKGEQGDAIFAKDGIDTLTDPDNVIFTLADGSKLALPKALALSVGFDSYESFLLTSTADEVKIMLPATLQETDYTAMVAEIKTAAGTGMDIASRTSTQPWKVTLTKPEFVDGKYQDNAKVKVEAGEDAANGDKAVLKITIINAAGKEISVSRVIELFNGVVLDVAQGGGLQAAVQAAIAGTTLTEQTLKGVRVSGTMNDADFEYVRETLKGLECLDLSGTDITELPYRALCFYDSPNLVLQEVVLPEGLTTIGNSAFAMCKALEKLTLPSTVTQLGRWILEGCKELKTINIPSGVTELPLSCFYDAGLTSINIPSTVTVINNYAFDNCPLEKVVIPSSVTSLGEPLTPPDGNYTFGSSRYYEDNSVAQLKEVEINANVTEIPDCCFAYQQLLAKVTIPACVKRIGGDAFSGCPIESVTLPENLEVIGARAFAYAKFTTLTIPGKVTTIGCSAFNGCKLALIDLPASIQSLNATAFNWKDATTVICRATAVPEVPLYDDFNNKFPPFYQLKKGNCKLQVPAASLQAYKDAWGQYFGGENIEAIQ